jgi:hypothetical protein
MTLMRVLRSLPVWHKADVLSAARSVCFWRLSADVTSVDYNRER